MAVKKCWKKEARVTVRFELPEGSNTFEVMLDQKKKWLKAHLKWKDFPQDGLRCDPLPRKKGWYEYTFRVWRTCNCPKCQQEKQAAQAARDRYLAEQARRQEELDLAAEVPGLRAQVADLEGQVAALKARLGEAS